MRREESTELMIPWKSLTVRWKGAAIPTAIASNLRQYFVRVERVKRGLINTFVEPFTHGGVFHVPTADCSFYNV